MSGLTELLSKNQSKVIYVLLIIFTIIPNIYPIILPIEVSIETRNFYETLRDITPGSTVMLSVAFSGAGWGSLGGAAIGTLNYFQELDVKVIVTPLSSIEGGLMAERCLALQRGGKNGLGEYGVDWVFLGYGPGEETFYALVLAEPDGMHKAFGYEDYYGNDISTLPMMDNILSHKDIDLLVHIGGGGGGHVVRQFYVPYGIPILTGDTGVNYPESKMFYDNDQIRGLIKDVIGAAEFESLIGIPGNATSTVQAVSINHLLIIILIIIGNIQYVISKRKGNGGK